MTNNEGPDPIDRRLREALRTTARADAELGASPTIEARLLADVRARRKAHQRRQMAWLAAAAAIVIAVTAVRWQMGGNTTSPEPGTTVTTGSSPTADGVPTDFLPLRYADVPAGHGQIVQMVVPATALASFGLDPSSAGADAVTADVFVGEDGLARAVRFSPFRAKELVR